MNDDNAAAGGFDPNDLTTGQVVGIAVGAAFALGAAVAALGPNEPEKPAHSGGRRTVVRGAHSVVRENPSARGFSVVRNGTITGRTRRRLEQEAASLQQEIERLGKIAEQQEREALPPVAAEQVLLSVSGMESATMADDPMVAVLKNGKLTRRTRKQLRKQAEAIQKDIDRLDKAVRSESYRQTHPAPTADDLREKVGTFGQDAGQRLAVAGAATTAALSPLVERAQEIELPKGARQAAERAQKNIGQFASNAQQSAGELAEAGQKNASQFAGSAQKSARQFADAAREQTADLGERVRDDFLPQLAAQANKLQERVQEGVPQLAERVRDDFVPQIAERVQQFRDELLPQVADAAGKAGAQVSALAATGAALSRDKARDVKNSDLADQVGDLAKQAKKQTRKGRKEAVKNVSAFTAQLAPQKQRRDLSGLWTVAALAAVGGTLYYVFGNEERRNKVIATARSLVEQGREIIRDFQGYDEEF